MISEPGGIKQNRRAAEQRISTNADKKIELDKF
jgi:hypothetical protein